MRAPSTILVLLCVLATSDALAQQANPRVVVSNFYEENDVFADTDQHYTQGLKLSYLVEQDGTPPWMERLVPRLWSLFGDENLPSTYNSGWSLGQNIYTPDDINFAGLNPDDRPYAGWLYVGRLLQISDDCDPTAPLPPGADPCRQQQHSFELDLGVVGPASQAGWAQTKLHEIIESDEPMGWDYQLGNEPAALLLYRGRWRFPNRSLTFDAIPSAGFALGNVLTYLSAGGMVRLGRNLSGFGGDVLPGVNRIRPASWEAYGFAGAEGRLVGVNIFLDGNHFRESASVDKKSFVYDLSYGAAVRYKPLRVTYTRVVRSQEFEPRSGRDLDPQEFGSVILSWERSFS